MIIYKLNTLRLHKYIFVERLPLLIAGQMGAKFILFIVNINFILIN